MSSATSITTLVLAHDESHESHEAQTVSPSPSQLPDSVTVAENARCFADDSRVLPCTSITCVQQISYQRPHLPKENAMCNLTLQQSLQTGHDHAAINLLRAQITNQIVCKFMTF